MQQQVGMIYKPRGLAAEDAESWGRTLLCQFYSRRAFLLSDYHERVVKSVYILYIILLHINIIV